MSASQVLQLPPDVLKQIPAATPPPGEVSNLANPYSRAYVLQIVTSIFLAIGVVSFIVRLYVKTFLIKRLSWDDLTLFLGLLGLIATYVGAILQSVEGTYGRHMWDVSVWTLTNRATAIYNYLSTVFLTVTLGFLKLSVFIMYFQTFWPMRWLRIAVYIGASVTCLFYGSLTIYQFVISTPKPGESWSHHLVGPQQAKTYSISLPTGIAGVITDVFLLVLPIPAVVRLQMPAKKKLGVLCVFATGLLACVASGVGIMYRLDLQAGDPTWEGVNLEILIQVEMNAGIVICSTPAISKMFSHYVPAMGSFWSKTASRLAILRSGKSRSQRSDSTSYSQDKASYRMYGIEKYNAQQGITISPPVRTVTIDSYSERMSDDKIRLTADDYYRPV